jgi:acyl carrier protein
MTISSRTPEGLPHHCPICGQESALEPSFPGGDSTCPTCGHLLWWFRDRLALWADLLPESIDFDSSTMSDLGIDSLELVELIMELEEQFGVTIPDEAAENFTTIADVIRYIVAHRDDC